ncbi:hypothetical protein [Zavarzinella formosa]|uniref:hypothetical protein n=1 Tax=Zavarzinella formosa TaxID=360055 RepID=UPI000368FECC|nr:hypothetical protein [Zavarzinella formosa]
MRSPVSFGALVILGLAAINCPAAPTLPDKPARWEYAELQFRNPRAGGFPGRIPAKGEDGAEQPPAPATTPTAVRWTTSDGEIEAKNWQEMAEKLKAPAMKKDASATSQKIHVLNFIGGEGWELVEHQGGSATATLNTWTFKRRVP